MMMTMKFFCAGRNIRTVHYYCPTIKGGEILASKHIFNVRNTIGIEGLAAGRGTVFVVVASGDAREYVGVS